MPKTRQNIRFTLDADYSGMLHILRQYDASGGTASQYVARHVKETLAEFTTDLWHNGHIWVPRHVLRRAVADLAESDPFRTTEKDVAHYMALFDEAYGVGQDSPYWIPPGLRRPVQVVRMAR